MDIQFPMIGHQNKQQQVPVQFPPQHQPAQPGIEAQMNPKPIFDNPGYRGSGKLNGKAALVTGGDSGIGRAVCVAFAKEGADVAIVYQNEHQDAADTKRAVEALGGRCVLIAGDLGGEPFCRQAVEKAVSALSRLDVLVNNAGVQFPQNSISDISAAQLEATFRVNFFAMFHVSKAALPHLKPGGAIINTASITAYAGQEQMIDYSATKGAIVSFTRSLARSLVKKGIRVNAVAPGPIWTPLQPASQTAEYIPTFGSDTPMGRAGQPFELAPSYVYLASDDSSYVTGQVLHVDGGASMQS